MHTQVVDRDLSLNWEEWDRQYTDAEIRWGNWHYLKARENRFDEASSVSIARKAVRGLRYQTFGRLP